MLTLMLMCGRVLMSLDRTVYLVRDKGGQVGVIGLVECTQPESNDYAALSRILDNSLSLSLSLFLFILYYSRQINLSNPNLLLSTTKR